jgi:hypothetical protein
MTAITKTKWFRMTAAAVAAFSFTITEPVEAGGKRRVSDGSRSSKSGRVSTQRSSPRRSSGRSVKARVSSAPRSTSYQRHTARAGKRDPRRDSIASTRSSGSKFQYAGPSQTRQYSGSSRVDEYKARPYGSSRSNRVGRSDSSYSRSNYGSSSYNHNRHLNSVGRHYVRSYLRNRYDDRHDDHHHHHYNYYGRGYYPYYGYGYPYRTTGFAYRSDPVVYETTNVYVEGFGTSSSVYGAPVYGVASQPGTASYPSTVVGDVEYLPAQPITGGSAQPQQPLATQAPAQATQQQGRSAVDYFREGNYERARTIFSDAMLAQPQDHLAKWYYAVTNFATGDYMIAASSMRRAMNGDSRFIEMPPDLKQAYLQPGLLQSHLANLELQADAQQNSDLWFLLGTLRMAADEPGAVEALRRAADLNPDDVLVGLALDAAIRGVITVKPNPESNGVINHAAP